MGQQTKKTDKVSKSDKISKSDKHAMFLKKAEKIANEFVSVFDDTIIIGSYSSNAYIISLEHFGSAKSRKLNKLCFNKSISYFCLYDTHTNMFNFYLYD